MITLVRIMSMPLPLKPRPCQMPNTAQRIVLALCVALGAPVSAQVVNEGAGSRRESLDAMVFSPADTSALLAATDWIGTKPTPADFSGNPVLVFTWAEWYRPSHAVALLAKALAEEHAGAGLVVIGVHDAEGWDEAKGFAESRGLGFPIVRDEAGAIRKALLVDQDPDIYVIDRAGQMRYADISTESLRAAVDAVVVEDKNAASSVEARLKQEKAEAERARRNPQGINEGVAFDQIMDVPFPAPAAEAYAGADWPRNRGAESDSRSRGRDEQGPAAIAIPAAGWYKERAPSINGRVRLIYTWHPADRDTMDRLMVRMDEVQRRLGRDVVVIGVLAALSEDRRRGDEPTDPIRAVPITTDTIARFVGTRDLQHYLVASPESFVLPSLENSRNSSGLFGSVGVVSTDGILRRIEHWSRWDDIQRALEQTMRVDPGVQARREAENAFIRGGR